MAGALNIRSGGVWLPATRVGAGAGVLKVLREDECGPESNLPGTGQRHAGEQQWWGVTGQGRAVEPAGALYIKAEGLDANPGDWGLIGTMQQHSGVGPWREITRVVGGDPDEYSPWVPLDHVSMTRMWHLDGLGIASRTYDTGVVPGGEAQGFANFWTASPAGNNSGGTPRDDWDWGSSSFTTLPITHTAMQGDLVQVSTEMARSGGGTAGEIFGITLGSGVPHPLHYAFARDPAVGIEYDTMEQFGYNFRYIWKTDPENNGFGHGPSFPSQAAAQAFTEGSLLGHPNGDLDGLVTVTMTVNENMAAGIRNDNYADLGWVTDYRWSTWFLDTVVQATSLSTASQGAPSTIGTDPNGNPFIVGTWRVGMPSAGVKPMAGQGLPLASGSPLVVSGADRFDTPRTVSIVLAPEAIVNYLGRWLVQVGIESFAWLLSSDPIASRGLMGGFIQQMRHTVPRVRYEWRGARARLLYPKRPRS